MPSIAAIILAAGKGTRMKSDLPKVMHLVAGRPLLDYPLTLIQQLKIPATTLVVAKDHAPIRAFLKNRAVNGTQLAIQDPPLGTGHAVMSAFKKRSPKAKHYLILSGDVPLVSRETIQKLIAAHQAKNAALTLVTASLDSPGAYGRVVRAPSGQVTGIVEMRDASPQEAEIKEINLAIYLIEAEFLKSSLTLLTPNNSQKEYYLTDLVRLAAAQGRTIETIFAAHPYEGMGVNNRKEILQMEKMIMAERLASYSEAGVRFVNPDGIYIDAEVTIGAGTVVYGPNYLLGKTKIGADCVIKAYCYIEDSSVAEKALIGPFAHLRPGSEIGPEAKIGNFVEIKKSKIGAGSKVNHLSYIGDAVIGKKVNVGAGTITCNYDGVNKFKTVLEDGVFVGSDTQFVAPVRVGKGAYIGAGSTITKNVKPGSLALTRTEQKEIRNWKRKK
ncbi:MAG: bifunctional UDP-N-acetylglucosamine diphosphorylase/glucosamine-1-phosphate N-acetyltransferase GlmU [Deltaproteobacteria bacterium]|nr:bifunctional UDP-N-acetylglucosamine diphosphorylase/glucosamine-1-phosphate N-acetyltransferase GlmU [Deltaproteobacteria bacterium]